MPCGRREQDKNKGLKTGHLVRLKRVRFSLMRDGSGEVGSGQTVQGPVTLAEELCFILIATGSHQKGK